MDKRKTIIVWMDGKKTKITKNNNTDEFTREQAATREDNGENKPIPTYVRQNTIENEVPFKKGKKQNTKNYKQIFIAGISAIVLGVGLGLFMLNMFTNIDTDTINPLTKTSGQPSDSSSGAATTEASTYKLESLEAFVLQAGLFNDETNLSKVQEKFEQAGLVTMVWKSDNQFYLFANIAGTKDQADSKKTSYQEMDLETYAKKWQTSETEVNITKGEYEWLQRFNSLWNQSLQNVSNNKALITDDWNKWIEAYPTGGEKTAPFYEKVKSLQSDIKDANETTSPNILLKLWNAFDNSMLN